MFACFVRKVRVVCGGRVGGMWRAWVGRRRPVLSVTHRIGAFDRVQQRVTGRVLGCLFLCDVTLQIIITNNLITPHTHIIFMYCH